MFNDLQLLPIAAALLLGSKQYMCVPLVLIQNHHLVHLLIHLHGQFDK